MATFVQPYIERGLWIVSCGVFWRGVSGPNDPIEEGVNTAQPFSLAISRIFMRPSIWMCHASCGFLSATAERRAARL